MVIVNVLGMTPKGAGFGINSRKFRVNSNGKCYQAQDFGAIIIKSVSGEYSA